MVEALYGLGDRVPENKNPSPDHETFDRDPPAEIFSQQLNNSFTNEKLPKEEAEELREQYNKTKEKE